MSQDAISQMPFISLSNHGRINELRSTRITHGDIIRFGKVCMRVIETHEGKAVESPLGREVLDLEENEDEEGMVHRQCRICLQDDDQDDLVSPCECRGSCKHVHMGCLKRWI